MAIFLLFFKKQILVFIQLHLDRTVNVVPLLEQQLQTSTKTISSKSTILLLTQKEFRPCTIIT